MFTVTRYHDISCGHRVVGHENKCRYLHGHNYRIHFTLQADKLDEVGRVLDFSVIKSKLCQWLEDNWDHKFLAWNQDQMIQGLRQAFLHYHNANNWYEELSSFSDSIVFVPFNPTAENMGQFLVETVGPELLKGTGCTLIVCRIEETRKCSATYLKGALK